MPVFNDPPSLGGVVNVNIKANIETPLNLIQTGITAPALHVFTIQTKKINILAY